MMVSVLLFPQEDSLEPRPRHPDQFQNFRSGHVPGSSAPPPPPPHNPPEDEPPPNIVDERDEPALPPLPPPRRDDGPRLTEDGIPLDNDFAGDHGKPNSFETEKEETHRPRIEDETSEEPSFDRFPNLEEVDSSELPASESLNASPAPTPPGRSTASPTATPIPGPPKPSLFESTELLQCALQSAVSLSLKYDVSTNTAIFDDKGYRRHWSGIQKKLSQGSYRWQSWVRHGDTMRCNVPGKHGDPVLAPFSGVVFEEFEPTLFQRIRRAFHNQLAPALQRGGGVTPRKNDGGSRSGVQFFKVGDSEFFIKETTFEQARILKNLVYDKDFANSYFGQFGDGKETLLPRYLGVYKLTASADQWGDQQVPSRMYAVFSSVMMDRRVPQDPVRVFDIKTSRDREVCWTSNPVGHLGNFYVHYNPLPQALGANTTHLALSPPQMNRLSAAIDRDIQFLHRFNLCDWSLLLVVREAPAGYSSTSDELSDVQVRMVSAGDVPVYPALDSKENFASQFRSSPPGQKKRLIYYLGIIDILTEFSTKRVEASAKYGFVYGHAKQLRHHFHNHYMGCLIDMRFLGRNPGHPRLTADEEVYAPESEIEMRQRACTDQTVWSCEAVDILVNRRPGKLAASPTPTPLSRAKPAQKTESTPTAVPQASPQPTKLPQSSTPQPTPVSVMEDPSLVKRSPEPTAVVAKGTDVPRATATATPVPASPSVQPTPLPTDPETEMENEEEIEQQSEPAEPAAEIESVETEDAPLENEPVDPQPLESQRDDDDREQPLVIDETSSELNEVSEAAEPEKDIPLNLEEQEQQSERVGDEVESSETAAVVVDQDQDDDQEAQQLAYDPAPAPVTQPPQELASNEGLSTNDGAQVDGIASGESNSVPFEQPREADADQTAQNDFDKEVDDGQPADELQESEMGFDREAAPADESDFQRDLHEALQQFGGKLAEVANAQQQQQQEERTESEVEVQDQSAADFERELDEVLGQLTPEDQAQPTSSESEQSTASLDFADEEAPPSNPEQQQQGETQEQAEAAAFFNHRFDETTTNTDESLNQQQATPAGNIDQFLMSENGDSEEVVAYGDSQ